jgi:hypothetical protein
MHAATAVSSPSLVVLPEPFERLEAEITELWGHLNAATYRWLVLIAKYDREEGYARHGLVNTAQWLNWQCGIGPVAAREKVRVARALESLPQVSAAFASGELSYSKVRAMTRVATPKNESMLVHVARYGTASHVEKLVRRYRWTQRRDAAKQAENRHLARELHCFHDDDGALVLHARLPADAGALVLKALQVAGDILREESRDAGVAEPNVSAETSETKQLAHPLGAKRADALRRMAETFLATTAEEVEATSSADRYQVVVHVDQAVLTHVAAASEDEPHRCELDDGPALAIDTVRRLSCDATLVGIVEGRDGSPLDVGRKTRAIPQALDRALRSRDGGCRFPGCDRTRFTQGHHVKHWADGGPTKLANLVTLCGFHHRLVHEGGYGVCATDDGVFVFTRPSGERIPASGPPHGASRDCFRGNKPGFPPMGDAGLASFDDSLKAYLQRVAPDTKIDASTARSQWLGDRLDYSLAIEALQTRDHGARLDGRPVRAAEVR